MYDIILKVKLKKVSTDPKYFEKFGKIKNFENVKNVKWSMKAQNIFIKL